MKRVFFSMLFLTANAIAFAQSDPYLTIENKGGGKIKVINHQGCQVNLQIDAPGATGIIPSTNGSSLEVVKVPAGESIIEIVNMPAVVKIRALSLCDYKGQSPIWLILGAATNLPARVKNIQATIIREVKY